MRFASRFTLPDGAVERNVAKPEEVRYFVE